MGLAAILWAAGCYKPAIVDGGFRCSTDKRCPDGMICVQDHCYQTDSTKIPTDASTTDARDGGPNSDATMCVPKTVPTGACVVQTDLACDPVCQTGCCPEQKCTALNMAATDGTLAATLGCSPAAPVRDLGEPCDPGNAGTPTRFDNCRSGLACVDGDMGAFCLKLCRGDVDCGDGIRCEQRRLDTQGTTVVSVCGLPATDCTPTTISGCPAQRTCYLVDTNASGDRTICDISAGQGKQMTSCRYARDCFPGYTCATSGPGVGRCWPVCTLPGGNCPGVFTCQNVGKTYGYCD